MTSRLLALALLTMSFPAACMQPRGMYQDAEIRMAGSVPCFTVPDKKETRRSNPALAAISVDRYNGSDWEGVWYWITPEHPVVLLSPEECILFGQESTIGRSQAPLAPLRPGERYHLAINAEIPNPSKRGDRTLGRMYSRDFCLRADQTGELEIILVPRMQGVVQWQLCKD